MPPFCSRSCQRLAHELKYYNLEAAQLDERLQPDYRLLMVGGSGENDPDSHRRWLRCFDHKAGGWGRLGVMDVERRCGCGAAAVGSYLYAFGGQDATEDIGCITTYNMATNSMGEAAKPPIDLRCCAAVACGGLLYSVGGVDVELERRADSVLAYKPVIDCWVDGPALPMAMSGVAAAEHMGCIYVCGGHMGDSTSPINGSLLMLDPRTRTWASLPAMPTAVGPARAAVVAGRMYVPRGGAQRCPPCSATTWWLGTGTRAARPWRRPGAPMVRPPCMVSCGRWAAEHGRMLTSPSMA